jgi:hypothetical protein
MQSAAADGWVVLLSFVHLGGEGVGHVHASRSGEMSSRVRPARDARRGH